MLTDTQISSFMVPQDIWTNGYPGRPDLPPLALPVRDALDIERRAQKDVNIRNEVRRYTLCCERIQGIVRELASAEDILPPPVIWRTRRSLLEDSPSAFAYLALAESLSQRLRNSAYARFAAIFFPPEHARSHFLVFEAICRLPDLDQFLERTSKQASRSDINMKTTASEYRIALDQRRRLLEVVVSEQYGLVDVIELV